MNDITFNGKTYRRNVYGWWRVFDSASILVNHVGPDALDEIARLQARIAELESENTALATTVHDLSPSDPLTEVEGTWPQDCPQRLFVQAAAWWHWKFTGTTLYPHERDELEAEAVRRYGEPGEGSK